MSKLSVFVKGTVIATVVALAVSSVAFAKGPVVKTPATTATSSQMSVQEIQNTWKGELAWLKFDNVILGRLDKGLEGLLSRVSRVNKADDSGRRPDRRFAGRLDAMLKEFETLLGKAEAVATAHAGFDANGKVTDQAQALKSVQTLGTYLDQMRGSLIYRLEHLA